MILPVYTTPQAILTQPTEAIREITAVERELVENMRETMHAAHGIGLAAPQVGSSAALFVLEVADADRESEQIPFMAMINPELVWRSALKSTTEEGCLSLPGVYGLVRRPRKVMVRFTDLEGKQRELTVDHLFARIVQHEFDHLRGILFTKYVPEEKRTYKKPAQYPTV
jgi:peptide deformylase